MPQWSYQSFRSLLLSYFEWWIVASCASSRSPAGSTQGRIKCGRRKRLSGQFLCLLSSLWSVQIKLYIHGHADILWILHMTPPTGDSGCWFVVWIFIPWKLWCEHCKGDTTVVSVFVKEVQECITWVWGFKNVSLEYEGYNTRMHHLSMRGTKNKNTNIYIGKRSI